jgi:8-hydroxy-5-deazaflavin:NADPH oxidoreductase
MKIGIIGTGNIGGTLTRRLTKLGHSVKIANSRGPQTLTDVAKETGAKPVDVPDAVRDVELIVVSIPLKSVPNLPKGLFADVGANVAVVDTGNYYPQQRDGRIDEIENGTPESLWVEKQIGHPVIKAFNTIYAEHLLNNGKPHGTPGRIALPVAGDDAHAKGIVIDIVDQLGFDPVDAGGLEDSWRQQPGTPVYGADYDAAGVRRALAEAKRERTPEFSAATASR